MTILNELIAPKDNADDEVLISKLYFSNGKKIQKGDELAELETSKTYLLLSKVVPSPDKAKFVDIANLGLSSNL